MATGEQHGPANQHPTLLISSLFLTFLRLGLTAFGGPAMVAYMRDLAVSRKCWLSEESFQNGVVLCQTIPGATAMQMAAYIGLRANGVAGALAAYIGFMLPAFVLMFALSAVYATTRDVPAIMSAFAGLRVIVVAVIGNAVISIGRKTIKLAIDVPVALASALFLGLGGSPVVAILSTGFAGLFLYRNEPASDNAVHATTVPRPMKAVGLGLLAVSVAVAGLLIADKRLAQLALIMMKVDILGFGGGFASVPLMMHEIVDVRQWLDRMVFMDGIALGQVTPGPICITATFVGYQLSGWAGALVGTVSIFATSFLVVLLAVPYFDLLYRSAWFRCAVRGILTAFGGLLLAVAINFGMAIAWSWPAVLLGITTLAALILGMDILWVVLAGGTLSAFIL